MEPITPADLSRELGVAQKPIRDFLRKTYGKLVPPTTRWHLTDEQAERVRRQFRAPGR